MLAYILIHFKIELNEGVKFKLTHKALYELENQ
jgi:hypothetical protein